MKTSITAIILFVTSAAPLSPGGLVERLQQKLDQHYQNNLITKTNIFFNQPAYMPGDTVFFSANIFFAEDLQRVPGYHVFDIRVIDQKGTVVTTGRIPVQDAAASGFVVLPETIPFGIYTLECTAPWQRNTPSFRAHYPIPVGGEPVWTTSVHDWRVRAEGGVLVAGIPNRVGFTGPADSNAEIITSSGSIAGTVNTGPTGIGIFNIVPDAQEQYHIRIGKAQVTLPPVSSEGVAIQLDQINDSLAELRIQGYPLDEFSNKNLILTLTHHSTVHLSAAITLSSSALGKAAIPLAELPEGIIVATLWNEKETILAERLFANPHKRSLVINSRDIRRDYRTREKVNHVVTLDDPDASGTFSLRVVASDMFGAMDGPGQSHDLHLWHDIEFGLASKKGLRIHSGRDLDVLLLTTPWTRYRLDSFLTGAVTPPIHVTSGQMLSGQLHETPGPSRNAQVWMYIEEEGLVISADVDDVGNFQTPLPYEVYGPVNIFYQVVTDGVPMSGARIKFTVPDDVELPPLPINATVDASHFPYRGYHSKINQINKVYATFTDRKNADSMHPETSHATFQPDATIRLDDFERFNTIEETIREVLPLMRHRRVHGKTEIRIWHDDINRMAEGPPLYLIDGRMTNDTDYFMNIPVSDIQTVGIVASTNRLGPLGAPGKNGVVVITTLQESHQEFPATTRIQYEGLQKSKAFGNISELAINQRKVPIIRSCLYWNPQARIEKSGAFDLTFFAPDNPGTFLIQLDGVTDAGKTVTRTDTIHVRHPLH